jgi:hypothetical protein
MASRIVLKPYVLARLKSLLETGKVTAIQGNYATSQRMKWADVADAIALGTSAAERLFCMSSEER